MKLIYKGTGEVIDIIFEDCDGNLRVINKNDTTQEGEYGSVRAFLKDFKDVSEFGGNPKYERQYRYAKTEKGKLTKHRAYLRAKAKKLGAE